MIPLLSGGEQRRLWAVVALVAVPLLLVVNTAESPTLGRPPRAAAVAPPPAATATATPSPTPTAAPVTPTAIPPATATLAPPVPVERSLRVPILMYHHVGPLPADADALRRDLTVAPERFAEQVDYLAREGYQTMPLAQLAAALHGEAHLPPKPVVLTFDDGYRDNYDYAFPMLQRAGYTGTFFVVTGLVGHAEYLTWEQIRAMADGGMEVQSHGRDHVDMSRLSAQALERQVTESRRVLESHLGRGVRLFAYPAGRYSPEVIAALRAAGYQAAVTTRHGSTHTTAEVFALRRVRVRGSDTLPAFASKLRP
ncbi:MAG: polysaccharide deacetylase family protein [Chloroflexi bacterium]|nr:polysaccharide deacetylase family protein [Chloroflexota bacterium]